MSTHTYERVKHFSVFRTIITMSGDINILATKTMVLFSASPSAATILQAKRDLISLLEKELLCTIGGEIYTCCRDYNNKVKYARR